MAMVWDIWKLLCICLSSFFSSSDTFLRLQTRNLSTERHSLFSVVIHLNKIILIAPTTYPILERSFSTTKRAKTSTIFAMTDGRLNHLLIIHIYIEELNKVNIRLITNEFIKVKKSRIATFGLYQF